METVSILFFAANYRETGILRLDEEMRAIKQKIRASTYKNTINLCHELAVRTEDLLQVLNEIQPNIIHFSGHGCKTGEIVLLDSYGEPKPVPQKALTELFKIFKNKVQVVVLNACYSKAQASAITEVIDCAIGIDNELDDKSSIIFAASFYSAIGFGCSVQDSFNQARVALLMEGISDENLPVLLKRKEVDPAKVVCVKRVGIQKTSARGEFQKHEEPSGDSKQTEVYQLKQKHNALITNYQKLIAELSQERNISVRKSLEQKVTQLQDEIQQIQSDLLVIQAKQ